MAFVYSGSCVQAPDTFECIIVRHIIDACKPIAPKVGADGVQNSIRDTAELLQTCNSALQQQLRHSRNV